MVPWCLLGWLGRLESLPHTMWSRLSSLLFCTKGLATKECKKHKEKSFCPNRFAKKLVSISADQWLKISHKKAKKKSCAKPQRF
jgi:hypothetical protein